MENQHKLIKGYRDLSPKEIDLMNALKNFEEEIKIALREIEDRPCDLEDEPARERWLKLARTRLEMGFMFALKAVAMPRGGLGRKIP